MGNEGEEDVKKVEVKKRKTKTKNIFVKKTGHVLILGLILVHILVQILVYILTLLPIVVLVLTLVLITVLILTLGFVPLTFSCFTLVSLAHSRRFSLMRYCNSAVHCGTFCFCQKKQ